MKRGRLYMFLEDRCLSAKAEPIFLAEGTLSFNDPANNHLPIITEDEFRKLKNAK